MLRILLLLILLPIVDLALMGHLIGFWNTLLLVLVTGVVGLMLIRYQGVNTLRAAQHKVATGQAPLAEIATGMFLAVAGLLLLHPGIITDILALLCLVPSIRRLLAGWFAAKATRNTHFRQTRPGADDVIEGEFESVSESANGERSQPSSLDHQADHKKK